MSRHHDIAYVSRLIDLHGEFLSTPFEPGTYRMQYGAKNPDPTIPELLRATTH